MSIDVELIIKSVKDDIEEHELQKALGALYKKDASHFAKLTQSLYGMKQPYVLLDDVSQEVAEKHKVRLEKLGLECSIQVGLSLVPIDSEQGDVEEARPAGTVPCPSCSKHSSDASLCSECGVSITKVSDANKQAESIKQTLDAAREEKDKKDEREKHEAEEKAIRKIKEESARAAEEKEQAQRAARLAQPADEEVFTAAYVDDDGAGKRKLMLGGVAAAAVVCAVAVGSGVFQGSSTVDPGDTIAVGDTASDETEVTNDDGADAASAATDATTTAEGTATGTTPLAGENVASAAATPAPGNASSAQLSQNIVAAATSKVEERDAAGPTGPDNFDETIRSFENRTRHSAASAEEVADQLAANMAGNKAKFAKAAGVSGAPFGGSVPGRGATLPNGGGFPSPITGSETGVPRANSAPSASFNLVPGAALSAAAAAQQLQAEEPADVEAMLREYRSPREITTMAGAAQTGHDSYTAGAQLNDEFFQHWSQRLNRAQRMTSLVAELLEAGQPELAERLLENTDDQWLAIYGHHRIAVAEQLAGDIDGSENRMMSLFVDLMMIRSVDEKIAALASHATTWHLMLNSEKTANTFGQMESMSEAPLIPEQAVVVNIEMAKNFAAAGQHAKADERYNHARRAAEQLRSNPDSRDQAIAMVAVAQAQSGYADPAIDSVKRISGAKARHAALARLQQHFRNAKNSDAFSTVTALIDDQGSTAISATQD